MSNQKLAVLAIIAAIVAAVAILQNQFASQAPTVNFSSAPLIEGLNIDAVNVIEVTSEQANQSVKLLRQNTRFVVGSKDNYPADAAKVNNLINQCLDIRVVDKITSNPENHVDLQVTEDTARNTVTFLDGEENPIVTLIVSPADPETNTAYVRLLSENDVYSIQSAPRFNAQPIDYIDTELISVPQSDVNSIAVKTAEGTYTLTSPEGTSSIHLEKIPDGKQLKDTISKTVFNALNSLRFEDVMNAAAASQELSFDQTYNCKLYDLTVYKLEIAENDDKTYVKVSADFLDKTPVEKTVGEVETDEQLQEKEAKLLAIDKVKEFNATHEGWIYQIPSYKADQLIKPLSELVEDIPQPEQPADSNDLHAQ